MFIKSFKFNKKLFVFIIIICILLPSILIFFSFANSEQLEDSSEEDTQNDYIKWVDFSVSYEALSLTSKLDIDSHNNNSPIKYNWIELLSYLACKNGRKL